MRAREGGALLTTTPPEASRRVRGLGFYISDFEKKEGRFVLSDLERLREIGEIKVVDEAA